VLLTTSRKYKKTNKKNRHPQTGKTKHNKLGFLAGVAAALNNYNLCKSQQLWATEKRCRPKGALGIRCTGEVYKLCRTLNLHSFVS